MTMMRRDGERSMRSEVSEVSEVSEKKKVIVKIALGIIPRRGSVSRGRKKLLRSKTSWVGGRKRASNRVKNTAVNGGSCGDWADVFKA